MGSRGGGPRLLIPIAAHQPAAGRERLRFLGDAARELFLAACVLQVDGEKLEAALDEVGVAVNQPRHGQAALQVNDLGIPAGIGLNLGVATHRQDAAIRDRHRFRKPLWGGIGARGRSGLSRPDLSVQ